MALNVKCYKLSAARLLWTCGMACIVQLRMRFDNCPARRSPCGRVRDDTPAPGRPAACRPAAQTAGQRQSGGDGRIKEGIYFASHRHSPEMAGLAITLLLVTAAIFGSSQALAIERRPEDALLDAWLQEQMEEVQSSPESNVCSFWRQCSIAIDIPLTQAADIGAPLGEDLGYATPGHAEEHDYMTAFFDNQDHDAVN